MGTFHQSALMFVGGMQPYAPHLGRVPPPASAFSGSLSDAAVSSDGVQSPMDCVCNSDTLMVVSFGFSASIADVASSSDAYTGGAAAPFPPIFSRAKSAAMQSVLSTWWKPVALIQLNPPAMDSAGSAAASPYVPYERAWMPTVLSAWQPTGIFRRP